MTAAGRTRTMLWILVGILLLSLAVLDKPWNPETLARAQVFVFAPDAPSLTLGDLLALCFWPCLALNLILVLLLIGTQHWWGIPGNPPPLQLLPANPGNDATRKFLTGAMIVSIALAGWMAFPRLSQSFWGDEQFTMREYLHGHFKRDPEIHLSEHQALPYFRLLSWHDAVWGYQTTNNHFLFTILGKASLVSWQKLSGAEPWEFREEAVRLLPFLAGLASIPCWMLLLYRLGFARAALLLGPFLAVHPWFMRYISEARGYAFIFLLLPLNLLILKRCLERGTWRHWLLHALTQFLLIYSWPGIAPQAAGANIGILVLIFLHRRPGIDRRVQVARWSIANLASTMVLAQLISPCVLQVFAYVDDWRVIPLDASWLKDVAGLLVFGTSWVTYYDVDRENPLWVSLDLIVKEYPLLLSMTIGLVCLFASIGARCWARRGAWGVFLLAVFTLPALTLFICGVLREKFLFPWYFVHLVPFILALALTGLTRSIRKLAESIPSSRQTVATALFPALAVLAFGGFLAWTQPKRSLLRENSLEPLRESVLHSRGSRRPGDRGQRSMITAHVHFGAMVYDPHGFYITEAAADSDTDPGLTRLMRWADQFEIPLFVNLGYPLDARKEIPDIVNLLENPDMFAKVKDVWGLEPQLNRELFRYKGGVFNLTARGAPGPPRRAD